MWSTSVQTAKHRVAFTIAEMLIALAVLSMLLAAAAVAIKACMDGYGENEEIATLTQSSRWVLNRIANDVRSAAAVDTTSTSITIIPPDTSTYSQIEYACDGGGNLVLKRTTPGGQTTSYPMISADGTPALTSFYVIQELGQDSQGQSCTKSITIRMSLEVDNQTTEQTISIAPRRNQLY